MLALLLVAVLASSVSATCPDVKVVSPFNATKYLGLWYEIAASPLIKNTFEIDCYCTNAAYGLLPNGTVSVHNVCNKGSPNGTISSIYGWAQTGQGADAAKLKVHFPVSPVAGNYWIVSVDEVGGTYDNAIVWSCESFLLNIEWMWILSRERTMSDATYNALTAKAKAITGYDAPNKLKKTVQTCTDSTLIGQKKRK